MKFPMKKIVILALMVAPFVGFSQAKPVPTDLEKKKSEQFRVVNPEFAFLEVVIAETSVGSAIRVDFGREQIMGIEDKELVAQLTEMRSTQFTSIPDLTAYLSSIGFKYSASYQMVVQGKNETHLMFEKRLGRKPGNMQGNADGKGAKPAVEPGMPPSPTTPAPSGSKATKPTKK
jgi:hypothetical protein